MVRAATVGIVLGALALVAPVAVNAQTGDRPAVTVLTRAVLDAYLLEPTALDAAKRTEIAGTLLSLWREIDSDVPRNSPDDERWLATESSSNNTTRISRAMASRQFAQRYLVNNIRGCTISLEQLPRMIGVDAAWELYLWSRVSYCFSDPNIPDYARIANVRLPGSAGGRRPAVFSFAHDLVAKKIPDAIIVQHSPTP